MAPGGENFRKGLAGRETDLFILSNSNGVQVSVTNYGARIVSFTTYNKLNEPVDIVVGFDSLEDYLTTDEIYHGAVIGRYANRIKNGSFSLDGITYNLQKNNGPNHLHGGPGGFHNVVWEAVSSDSKNLLLKYISADGEEGFPGTLTVTVRYELTDENELKINYNAESDKTTVINLTNHAYFNLNGQGSGSVLDHLLYINADHYTPIDSNLIPTGDISPVAGTAFDFTKSKTIGKDIEALKEQLINGNGYDHNFVLNKKVGELVLAAKAVGEASGIALDVFTTEPGVQLYTGNFMKGVNKLKRGKKDEWRSAFCLETQHYPDSPNQPHFPTTKLKAGETFASQTIYKVSLES